VIRCFADYRRSVCRIDRTHIHASAGIFRRSEQHPLGLRSQQMVACPHRYWPRRESLAHGYWANDYETERIATVAEVAARYRDYGLRRGEGGRGCTLLDERGKQDPAASMSATCGTFGSQRIIVLFLAHTGMNLVGGTTINLGARLTRPA